MGKGKERDRRPDSGVTSKTERKKGRKKGMTTSPNSLLAEHGMDGGGTNLSGRVQVWMVWMC